MDELNFFRLTKSIYSYVNETLRHVFLDEWSNIYKTSWSNDHSSGQVIIAKEKEGEKKLKKRSRLFKYKFVQVLTLISYGNVQKWDSSTLFFVLLRSHALYLQNPKNGWRPKLERSAPFVKGEYIDELREVRNYFLAHVYEAKISQDDYRDAMKRIRFAMVGLLGENHKILNNFDEFSVQEYFLSDETSKLREEITKELGNFQLLNDQLDDVETGIQVLENVISGKFEFQKPCSTSEKDAVERSVEKDRLNGLINRLSKITSQVDNVVSQCCDLSQFKNILTEESDKFLCDNDWEGFKNYIENKLKCCTVIDTTLLVKMELAKGLCHEEKLDDALQLLTSLISSAHLTRQSAIHLGQIFHLMSIVYDKMKDDDEATRYDELANNILRTYEAELSQNNKP